MSGQRGPWAVLVLFAAASGCAAAPVAPSAAPSPAAATVELVESSPVETTLDHADLRNASQVWPEMLATARTSIDLAEFYVSSAPRSALVPVLTALQSAVARGVRVRLLTEETMFSVYPDDLAQLAAAGVSIRRLDLRPLSGGILHAKYFVIDGREAFVGSQNFDWRSLEHIHELGVRLRSRELAQSLSALFEADWALAQGDRSLLKRPPPHSAILATTAQQAGEPVRIELAFSPSGWLLEDGESHWDLPRLLQLIDHAERSVRVELFLYHRSSKDGEDSPMGKLEATLRRAAERGVSVQLLLSDRVLRSGTAPRDPPQIPGVAIKIVTIPPWSGGDIPYARLIHAKYMVVDGRDAWIGTSNWEDRYFLRSRNVSVFLHSQQLATRLDQFFADLWGSPYAR